jgi:hypothetical protein
VSRRLVEHDVVIIACAISAGIHGALVREHFDEGAAAGIGFAASTVLLVAIVVALTVRPFAPTGLISAAAIFAGLIVSYVLATTTGFPVLHPEVEPVEGLAVATKVVEAIGLLAAVALSLRHRVWLNLEFSQRPGTAG